MLCALVSDSKVRLIITDVNRYPTIQCQKLDGAALSYGTVDYDVADLWPLPGTKGKLVYFLDHQNIDRGIVTGESFDSVRIENDDKRLFTVRNKNTAQIYQWDDE